MDEKGRNEGFHRETGAKSTRRKRDADAAQTETRSHGDKLKNEESRRKHYRNKVRVGKDDSGLSKQDLKALDKKKKQGRKQIRREIAAQDAVRRKTSDALNSLRDDDEDRSTAQTVTDTAENVAFGMVETVEQKAKNFQYSRKLHERAKKMSEEVEAGKKGAGSNELSKKMQKKRIRKEMTEAARKKAEKEAANQAGSLSKKFVDKAEDLAGKLAEWIGEHLAEHPLLVLAILAIGIVLMIVMASLSSCSMVGGGMTNVTIATSYTAKDQTIRDVENDYKNLEADLQTTIDNVERDHPGYDEYQYDLAQIGHNGHTDTLAAITGSIAEAFYGIPAVLIAECRSRVDQGLMLDTLNIFDETLGRTNDSTWDKDLQGNELIEGAIERLHERVEKSRIVDFVKIMVYRMMQEGEFIVPYITDAPMISEEKVQELQIGKTYSLDHDVRLKMETVTDDQGNEWVGVFTSSQEMSKGSAGNVQMSQSIHQILKLALSWEDVEGIVINPFGTFIQLQKEMVKDILDAFDNQIKAED